MFDSMIEDIFRLLEKNKVTLAAQGMMRLCSDLGRCDELRLQMRRISELESSFRAGTISFEEHMVGRSRIASALAAFAVALQQDSANTEIDNQKTAEHHLMMGNCWLSEELYRDSLPYFSKAIENSTHFFNAYLERGIAQCGLGSFKEAEQDFLTVIEICPDNPFAYFNHGIALLHLGDLAGACSAWRKVQSLGSSVADDHLVAWCEDVDCHCDKP